MFEFNAETISALAAAIALLVNLGLSIEARWNIRHLKELTNGQSEKLNAVSKALGHAEGVAQEKENPS